VTQNEAAQILAVLTAAYPNSPADEATATLWVNSLATADYTVAQDVVLDVVRTIAWWPSIAEFNGLMTARNRELARTGQGAPTSRITSALRCDGHGFIDRGHGLEPCPTCSPWLRTLFEEGDWNRQVKPPDDYVMPPPCRHIERGRIVSRAEGSQIALDAYLVACTAEGRDPTPTIVASLQRGDIPFTTTRKGAA
jgi:hypothetical protein